MSRQFRYVLSLRQRCDLDLILCGAYAPLQGFLTRRDYENVLQHQHLTGGALWPIPVTLDIPTPLAEQLAAGDQILLCREDENPLAVLTVDDLYAAPLTEEAESVYGTTDPAHAGIALLYRRRPWYVGGRVRAISSEAVDMARRVDFLPYYYTPAELKKRWAQVKRPVVAFHTRNPMHGAHRALTLAALEKTKGHLLLHPTTGPSKSDDVAPALRLKAIRAMAETYPAEQVTFASIPLPMRMAGPREALWHALIRQNFGADYFIVGRAAADPGRNPNNGSDGLWYPPYAAHEIMAARAGEMKIIPLFFPEYTWHAKTGRFLPVSDRIRRDGARTVSGTGVRTLLRSGRRLPEWLAPPGVREILENAHHSPWRGGTAILFTGLPGSGKSSLASALAQVLQVNQHRPVTMLDGDVLRRTLSRGLGFSRQDREEHLARVGYVARVAVRHGGIVLMALVAPYQNSREHLRRAISSDGRFLEVYVSTPIEVCEARDPKGWYLKARQGHTMRFTGVSDRYDPPQAPDLEVNLGQMTLAEAVFYVLEHLIREGIVDPDVLAGSLPGSLV